MLRKHFRQLRAKNTAIPAATAPITPNKDVIKAIFFTATQTCHIQSLYSVMIDKQRKTGHFRALLRLVTSLWLLIEVGYKTSEGVTA